jgi:hypothetical protein
MKAYHMSLELQIIPSQTPINLGKLSIIIEPSLCFFILRPKTQVTHDDGRYLNLIGILDPHQGRFPTKGSSLRRWKNGFSYSSSFQGFMYLNLYRGDDDGLFGSSSFIES